MNAGAKKRIVNPSFVTFSIAFARSASDIAPIESGSSCSASLVRVGSILVSIYDVTKTGYLYTNTHPPTHTHPHTRAHAALALIDAASSRLRLPMALLRARPSFTRWSSGMALMLS